MTNTERLDLDQQPPGTPPLPAVKRKEPTRRRLSLNLTTGDYADLEQLARWERATIHQTITRAVQIARRIHSAADPALRWPHLAPEDLPPAGYLALHTPHADGTPETVIALELL
jgi:hypothetical protein